MNILFANHHLHDRAGSELYTLELAAAVRDRGHQSSLFTFEQGPVAEAARGLGIPVYGPTDVAALEASHYDVAHVHHAPCLYFLGATRLRCPVVYSTLGVLPALESAPLTWAGVGQSLAVSEEVRDVIAAAPFGRAVPPAILRNWFDDRRPLPRLSRPARVRRVAVVTNHLDPTLREQLDAIAARQPGFFWTHFGLPDHCVEITADLLADFDAVVTIGRTALLAGALGKPCLLYDLHGCDGFLEAHRLERLATRNFSGRLSGTRPSTEVLEQLLLSVAPRIDVEAVAEQLQAKFPLSRRVDEVVAHHERAIASGARLGDLPGAYGRAGQTHVEARAQASGLRQRLAERDTSIAGLEQQLAETRAALGRQQRVTARRETELALQRQAIAGLRAELATTRSQLTALRASVGVRLIEASRRIPGVYSTYLFLKRARWPRLSSNGPGVPTR